MCVIKAIIYSTFGIACLSYTVSKADKETCTVILNRTDIK